MAKSSRGYVATSNNSSSIGFKLKLKQEEVFDSEIYGILNEKSILVITANGTFELSGTHLKVDTHKFNNTMCVIGEDIVYGGANGDIIYMNRIYIQRQRRIFMQKQALSKTYAKIYQIMHLADRSFTVLGIDSKKNYKISYVNISGDTLKILHQKDYQNSDIKGIISVDRKSFFVLEVDSSQKIKLNQIETETFNELNSIEIDTISGNAETKMTKAFKNKVIISCGNSIYCCNSEKLEKKKVISSEETSSICSFICIREYLIVFYKSSKVVVLNSQLDIVSTINNLFNGETLEKCYSLNNGSLCLVFNNNKDWSLRLFSHEIDDLVAAEVKLVILSETAKNIIKICEDIAKCIPATQEEKVFSSKKFELINKKPVKQNDDLTFIGIQKYVNSFGTELILCQSSDVNDYTNRLHANLLFNGFLDTNPNYYFMEFEANDEVFVNKKEKDGTNALFSEQFKNFISSNTNIPSDEIIITKIHNKNLSFDFTFTQIDYHKLFFSKINYLKDLIDKSLEQFSLKKTRLKKVELHPILKECKLNVNMFNPDFDRTYDTSFKDIRGQLPYNPPLKWTRLGLNIEYFGYSNDDDWIQMDKRPDEWAVAYHGLRHDPLRTLEKIINDASGKPTLKVGRNNAYKDAKNINKLDRDGYNKPCGDGIYCASNIDIAENYTVEFTTNNGEKVKLALMCRVNPYKLKIAESPYPDFPYYIVNESDDIRPYGVLLKHTK